MTFFQKQADDARPYGYSSAEVEAHTVERHAGRRMSETEHAIVHAMIGADHRHHYAEYVPRMTTPEELGLKKYAGIDTYLDDYETAWIGAKWDIAEDSSGRFAVYRKGNWRITVGTLDLACAIVADNEGLRGQ